MSQSSDLITDFLDTLTGLSTGSYVRESEREHWDPPYPPEVVGDSKEILQRLVQEVHRDPSEMSLAVISAYGAFSALNERHGGAIVEQEEEEDLRTIIAALATEFEADVDAVLADLDRLLNDED